MEIDANKCKSKTEDSKNGRRLQSRYNLVSHIFMCWILPVIIKANRSDLGNDDLIHPRHNYHSREVTKDFERFWFDEINRATMSNRKPSLWKAFRRAYFWKYVPSILFSIIHITARTMQPIVFAWLLSYWSVESTMTQREASYYAIALIAIILLGTLCQHHNTHFLAHFGMNIKVTCATLLYKKLLRLSQLSLRETSSGKLVNLMSNDLAKFESAFIFLNHLFIVPFQVIVILYFLYEIAGYAPFVGLFGVIFFILPLQVVIIKFTAYLKDQTADRTDKRLKIINEIIEGMQIIKIYAWEKPFETVVKTARMEEMIWLKRSIFWRSVFMGFTLFTERSILFFSILTLMLTGTLPVGTMIYPVQQYFNLIQANIVLVLPLAIANFTEMMVSLKRIEQFLLIDEKQDVSLLPSIKNCNTKIFNNNKLDTTPNGIIGKLHLPREDLPKESEVLIEVMNVSASWKSLKDTTELTLKDVSLQIKKNRLYAIVGRVGAGKSSLLQVFLKELPICRGHLKVNGRISYAAQESWLFPTTVRENILFGLPYDVDKYMQVCKACALISDFSQFPLNDLSMVGERGITLSGGQKARISLARAIYREADIYLLDDPLSAVDTKVGKHLFKECIKTYLRGRTCILITHHNQYVKQVDEVIIMNKGSIQARGPYHELVKSEKTLSLLQFTEQDRHNVFTDKLEVESSCNIKSETRADSVKRQVVEPEKNAVGRMKWSVLCQYLRYVKSWWFVFATFFTFMATQCFITMTDYFLSFWTNQVDKYTKSSVDGEELEVGMNFQIGSLYALQYIWIYGSMILLLIVISHIRLYTFVMTTMRASENLHDKVFKSLATTTMRFLDTNPSGRILNRLSNDIGAMDEFMPRCLLETLQMYLTIISVFILTTIALPWTLIPSTLFLIILIYIVKWYLIANQTVKRMDSITKSPIFSMLNSTLSGLPTIRSSSLQSILLQNFYDAQDLNSKACYTYLSGVSAFSLYLDLLCLFYLGAIIAFFIIFDFGDAIPIGYVGMAVSQTMQISISLRIASRYTADFLGHTVAVERVLQYTKLPTEDNLSSESNSTEPIDNSWPTHGRIVFENMTFKYNEHDTPVLTNINLEIKSGWKVGVVGRTGAGKSSLISALFRLYIVEGNIKIDGVNTNTITKKELRSKISIIPQQPILFSETVRYNLDPFNDYSDESIWKALEQVELKDIVPALDYKVSEGGSNFSVGQRQMLCLARAILRSNKILVMDEATANVDYQTDEFIQKTIRQEFASCTVITIAHRLNTIMDSDRVLVIDKGIALEFDHPYILLSKPNSAFASMINETGDSMSKEFLEIAKKKYLNDNQTK